MIKISKNLTGISKPFTVAMFMMFLTLFGCAKDKTVPQPTLEKPYILLEKQLADINVGKIIRHRTTAKIIVTQGFSPDKPNTQNINAKALSYKQHIEQTLKQALADILKDDPTLNAVIIWAYKNRSELNSSFTLGKLEYSKDKKGFDGKQKLSEEIIIETR